MRPTRERVAMRRRRRPLSPRSFNVEVYCGQRACESRAAQARRPQLSRAQDQGLQFGQTKSHAIIVHSPVPADCIYRVISQTGDRISFERLSTPRPAPKVTLKSSWQSQQQQSTCDDVSTSTRKLAQNSVSLVDKKPQIEIDLRVEGVLQDAI